MTGIDVAEALDWIECQGADVADLFARASRAREEHTSGGIKLCAIVNARCGGCPDDCSFCAQSSHNAAEIQRHALLSADELVQAARTAQPWNVARFSFVTSGRSISRTKDVAVLAEAARVVAETTPMAPCASLGRVDREVLAELFDAGLTRYHCNLETAESHFGNVCTTRRYSDTYDTLLAARDVGMTLCSGGIFGLGESRAQRVELLAKVRELGVESVPINFLHAIEGTPLESIEPIGALDCLKAVAVARLMMPGREIRICGGREHALGDLHSWVLLAGASGLMVGNYLTTAGRDATDDLRMIAAAGLTVEGPSTHAGTP